jgi:DnaJ-class molecular chaperone
LDDIKKAYRALSLQHHPDKSTDPASPAAFLAITAAYKFLQLNKSLYDNLLRQHDPAFFRDRLILVNS